MESKKRRFAATILRSFFKSGMGRFFKIDGTIYTLASHTKRRNGVRIFMHPFIVDYGSQEISFSL